MNELYRYRNTRTGVEITVPCKITGKNWELIHTRKDNRVMAEQKPRKPRKKE